MCATRWPRRVDRGRRVKIEGLYLTESRARQNRKTIPLANVERELGLASD